MAAHGVTLRPHLKTAKSIDVARRLYPDAPGPITVSTLAEAEYFAREGGFTDITYACLLYTSDAADERSSVDLGGRRIIKKKNKK